MTHQISPSLDRAIGRAMAAAYERLKVRRPEIDTKAQLARLVPKVME